MARLKKKVKVIQPDLKDKERKALPIIKALFELLAEAHGNVDFLYKLAKKRVSDFVDKHNEKAMEIILSGLFALKKTGEFPNDPSFYIILDVIVEIIKERELAKIEHTKRIARLLEWEEISQDFSVSRQLWRVIEKLNPDLAAEVELRLDKADRERKLENFEIDVGSIMARLGGGDCEATTT